MTKSSAYWMGLSALALLALVTRDMSARAAIRAPNVILPPAPKVTVRPPALSSSQQQSLWGINQNLQRDRDRWQRQKTPENTGPTRYLEY